MKPRNHHLALFHTYNTVAASTGMSLSEFCKKEGLGYYAVQKAFQRLKKRQASEEAASRQHIRTTKRHDWDAYRVEFLEGDFRNLSQFARFKHLRRDAPTFRKKTKGWLKAKSIIRSKEEAEKVSELAKKATYIRVGKLHGRVLIGLYKCLDGYEGIQKHLKGNKIKGPRDLKDLVMAIRNIQDGLKEIYELIIDFEESANSKDLLKKLIAGEIAVTEAGLRYAEMGGNLPEAVKILLSKAQPEEPEPEGEAIPTDEELEELYQAGIGRIKREEIEFVPQRQREVERLKGEISA